MRVQRNPCSCGGTLLWELADASEANLNAMLFGQYRLHMDRTAAQKQGTIFKGETVIFSDVVEPRERSNGLRLRDIIKEHELGEITSLKTVNPNTKRTIRTWVWVYNGKKIDI